MKFRTVLWKMRDKSGFTFCVVGRVGRGRRPDGDWACVWEWRHVREALGVRMKKQITKRADGILFVWFLFL